MFYQFFKLAGLFCVSIFMVGEALHAVGPQHIIANQAKKGVHAGFEYFNTKLENQVNKACKSDNETQSRLEAQGEKMYSVCQYAQSKNQQEPACNWIERTLYTEYPSHSKICIQTIAKSVNAIFDKAHTARSSSMVVVPGDVNHDGRRHRVTHSKTHGCAYGSFKVANNIHPELQVGLFKNLGQEYKVWSRFANGTSFVKDDQEGDARSLSFKLMGVPGKKLFRGQVSAQTFDFVMNNAPVFFIKSPRDFFTFFSSFVDPENKSRFLNSTLDKIKKGVQFFAFRKDEKKALDLLRNRKSENLLTEKYWSGVAVKWGPYAVKYAAIPTKCADSSLVVDHTKVSRTHKNYYREVMNLQMNKESQPACWNFGIQLQVDPWSMPIEDATLAWDEAKSPFITVGYLRLEPQSVKDKKKLEFCESLQFSNWRVTEEFRPLGDLNRLRREAYYMSAKIRRTKNQQKTKEPTVYNSLEYMK